MKQTILTITMFCLLLMFCGCGKETGKNLYVTNETVAADFTYEDCGSYIKITGYNGNESVVTIPETINGKPVTVLGEDSFYQKTEMTEIHLPSGIETIEKGAFYRCYALMSITIPETVTQIGTDTFFRCSSLQNITVYTENSNYCDIDGVLFNKDKTELIAYPEGKAEMQYTLPNSVTKIDDSAFGYKTNLKIIGIPSSVTELPDYNIFVYPDEITLRVAPDSIAETYAKEYNISYETDEAL